MKKEEEVLKAQVKLAMEADLAHNQTSKELVIRDLFSKPIRTRTSWRQWLVQWNGAETFEEMSNLLFDGFITPLKDGSEYMWGHREYTREDRILFYLKQADGWDEYLFFDRKGDYSTQYPLHERKTGKLEMQTMRDLRKKLAEKAFEELCVHFFKVSPSDPQREERHEWMHRWITKMTPTVFAGVMSFYRIEPQERHDDMKIVNLPSASNPSHHEKTAINFLLELSKFIWEWKECKIESWHKPEEQQQIGEDNTLMRNLIDSAQLWMIEILARLGEINMLRSEMFKLSDACVAKITEIAMRSWFTDGYSGQPVRKARRVLTLHEACVVNSAAAWFLHRRQLLIDENERLWKLRRAADAADAAQKEFDMAESCDTVQPK